MQVYYTTALFFMKSSSMDFLKYHIPGLSKLQPTTCFCYMWAKNGFYIFKWFEGEGESKYFMTPENCK